LKDIKDQHAQALRDQQQRERNLEVEVGQLREQGSLESRGMNTDFQALQRKLQDAESNEQRLNEELAAYKEDRERRLTDNVKVQEKERE